MRTSDKVEILDVTVHNLSTNQAVIKSQVIELKSDVSKVEDKIDDIRTRRPKKGE